MSLRLKKPKSHEEIEITFVKSDVSSWSEQDDDQNEKSTSFTSEAEKPPSINETPSRNSLDVNYDSNSVVSELSSVSSFDGPIDDVYCKRRSIARTNNRTHIQPSVLNHFLDFLSTCFWKCSAGCQQLPDKRY